MQILSLKKFLSFFSFDKFSPKIVLEMCRYGYLSLDDMKTRVSAVREYGIPIDVAYADIDYMDRYKDFTIGKVSDLH